MNIEEAGVASASIEQEPPIIVVGAGGHSLVVIDVLQSCGRRVLGCVTDDGQQSAALPVYLLGVTADIATLAATHRAELFVAIGDNIARRRVQRQIVDAGLRLATAISPRAMVSGTASVDTGSLVMPGVVISAQARIGAGVIVNSGAVVEHECVIGDFVHLAPRVALAGRVIVGDGVLIGIGAAVLPGIAIGAGATVGAGAVVVHEVAPGATVVGVPARVVTSASGA